MMHTNRWITHCVCLIPFVWAGLATRAQNLVPNPGFEFYTQCPGLGADIGFAAPWNMPQNFFESVDYYHVCATSIQYTVPCNCGANCFNYQQPAGGNAYAGFYLYHGVTPDYREYLQTPLNSPMQPGQMYRISFQVVSLDYAQFATNAFGGYFSAGPVVAPVVTPNWQPLPINPHFTCPVPVTDEVNWMPFYFYYQATGGEQNLLLGNFFNDASTPVIVQPSTPNESPSAYIFLDEVYVEAAEVWITATDTIVCGGTPVTLTAHGNGPFQWATAAAPGNILSTSPTFTPSPGQTSTYYAYGTGDTGIYTVYVLPTPAPINLGPDTAYCEGDFVQLIAAQTGNIHYLWQDQTDNHTYYPTQTGTYWVQASIGNCHVSDTVVLSFSTPEAHLPGDTILCQGQTLLLDATWPQAHYLWDDGHTGPTQTIHQTGTYSVQVSIGNCTDTDEIQVTVTPYPVPDLGPDRTVCDNALPLLDATRPGATYVWQNGSTAATYPVTQAGQYWVNVSLGPCTATDSVYITLIPAPQVSLGPDTLPCKGDTLWLDATGADLTYLWNDASPLAVRPVSQSGTYAVQVTHSNGCTDVDSITVTYIDPPHVQFTDSTLCRGDVWLLDIQTPLGSYLWQDKTEDPTYYIQHEGVYWASINNPCGSDSDTLEITYQRCDCALYVPNCFSPDGNGGNEYFVTQPHPDCLLEEFTLTVYDRWGDVLFGSTNPDFYWNGYRNGKAVPSGMYLYLIRYKFDKTPLRELRGHVLVLR